VVLVVAVVVLIVIVVLEEAIRIKVSCMEEVSACRCRRSCRSGISDSSSCANRNSGIRRSNLNQGIMHGGGRLVLVDVVVVVVLVIAVVVLILTVVLKEAVRIKVSRMEEVSACRCRRSCRSGICDSSRCANRNGSIRRSSAGHGAMQGENWRFVVVVIVVVVVLVFVQVRIIVVVKVVEVVASPFFSFAGATHTYMPIKKRYICISIICFSCHRLLKVTRALYHITLSIYVYKFIYINMRTSSG